MVLDHLALDGMVRKIGDRFEVMGGLSRWEWTHSVERERFDADFVGGGGFLEGVVVVGGVCKEGIFVGEVVLGGDEFGGGVVVDVEKGALVGDVA